MIYEDKLNQAKSSYPFVRWLRAFEKVQSSNFSLKNRRASLAVAR
ncbi:hypothetical protein BH10ACI1_BH10ACI1_21790 [soil metagenome]